MYKIDDRDFGPDGLCCRNGVRDTLLESSRAARVYEQLVNLNPGLLVMRTKFTCRRRGQETKIKAGEAKPEPDQTLIKALRNAHAWAEALKSGTPIKDFARSDRCSDSYARRVIPLATLSPKLQSAILDGTMPAHITVEAFIRSDIPLDWQEQEVRFGTAT